MNLNAIAECIHKQYGLRHTQRAGAHTVVALRHYIAAGGTLGAYKTAWQQGWATQWWLR